MVSTIDGGHLDHPRTLRQSGFTKRLPSQDVALMRGLKAERDVARSEVEDAQQMGKTLYAVERIIGAMERETGPADQAALETVVQALDQLKTKPNAEIVADISQRLKDLGYSRPDRPKEAQSDPELGKTDPHPSKDNDRGRLR